MNAIYRQLCCDHKQMQELLNTFEQLLLDLFDCGDRDPSTLSLILDTLDYLSAYPDRYHHPVEDLIFSRLLTKPIHDRESIYEAQMQHESIAAATKHMCALFYAIANDATVERKVLQEACNTYLRLQYKHMELENEAIFPQIEQYLGTTDWIYIQKQVSELSCKYFDRATRKIYESLYENLTQPQMPAQALA